MLLLLLLLIINVVNVLWKYVLLLLILLSIKFYFSSLIVNLSLYLTVLKFPARFAVRHLDYISSAHGAYLQLSEPFPEASLVEDMRTVRNHLQTLTLIEFF